MGFWRSLFFTPFSMACTVRPSDRCLYVWSLPTASVGHSVFHAGTSVLMVFIDIYIYIYIVEGRILMNSLEPT